VQSLLLRLKRAETPFFKHARRVCNYCFNATIPVPSMLKPAGRFFYELRFFIPILWTRFSSLVYATPLFCCRCESVGKHLQLQRLPVVSGHTLLHVGDDVRFSGSFAVYSGRFGNRPTLRIGNRVFIGSNVTITCNQEVVIEDDVLIASNCRISDYDGHPSSLEKRISRGAPDPEDIRPVRIRKGAWIGCGAHIFKGVTIGAGSIVGANSVVTHDVPAYCVVAGSPARVVKPPLVASAPSCATTVSAAVA
jgi:acetyltransferase-like isoleucine patch superfamily enzyme